MRAHSIKYEPRKNIELRKTSPAQAPTYQLRLEGSYICFLAAQGNNVSYFIACTLPMCTYRVIQDLSYIRFLFVFILCCLCYENWIYLHNMFRRLFFVCSFFLVCRYLRLRWSLMRMFLQTIVFVMLFSFSRMKIFF